jgi:hypothetical protein
MMTVNRYADLVIQILETNDIDMWLEDHEVEWVVDCHHRGFPPSLCAFGLADCREAYQAVMREEQMYDRIDAQLMRKAA